MSGFRVMAVVAAEDLRTGDHLVGTYDQRDSGIFPLEITQTFNTGHARVQITTPDETIWFNVGDLVSVLREIS